MTFKKVAPNSNPSEDHACRNIIWIKGFGISIEHEAIQPDDIRYCELFWDGNEKALGFKFLSENTIDPSKAEQCWRMKSGGNAKIIHDIAKEGLALPWGVYNLEKASNSEFDYIANLNSPVAGQSL